LLPHQTGAVCEVLEMRAGQCYAPEGVAPATTGAVKVGSASHREVVLAGKREVPFGRRRVMIGVKALQSRHPGLRERFYQLVAPERTWVRERRDAAGRGDQAYDLPR
jgi:hypothetical protein